MKTFVFTNRVYPPVGGATGELLKELAEGLVDADTRVVVVTSRERGAGNPEVGEQRSETRGQSKRREAGEVINGVEVIRVGTATFTRASHWRRAVSYLGLYPQLMWQVWKLGKVDAVVSMTDPPLQVAAVTLASFRARKKIHWAQDVYPELAEELGVIGRGGILARLLRSVSTWALQRQDEVAVVGRCMRERLVRRGIDAGKIEVIANWSSVTPVTAEQVEAMRGQLGWSGKFIVLYSGNIGLAHDFETLVGAAKLLEGSGAQMVFAGEGPRLEQVRRDTEGLDHVSFLPSQPKEDLSAFLAAADAHLVSVRAGLEGLVVPSKAYGILATGRPTLYVGGTNSEVAKVIAESGGGTVISNGNAAGLAEAIKQAVRRNAGRAAGGQTPGFARTLAMWREVLG